MDIFNIQCCHHKEPQADPSSPQPPPLCKPPLSSTTGVSPEPSEYSCWGTFQALGAETSELELVLHPWGGLSLPQFTSVKGRNQYLTKGEVLSIKSSWTPKHDISRLERTSYLDTLLHQPRPCPQFLRVQDMTFYMSSFGGQLPFLKQWPSTWLGNLTTQPHSRRSLVTQAGVSDLRQEWDRDL